MKRTPLSRKTPLKRSQWPRKAPKASGTGITLSQRLKPFTARIAKPKKTTKPKKIGAQKAKKLAWTAFSTYIRLRDALRTTGTLNRVICCSCGREMETEGRGMCHAGHFIPGRHASNLFDERGVSAQCYVCNVRLKGNWPAYYAFMKTRHGQAVIDELIAQDKKIIQRTVYELLEIKEKYEAKAKALRARFQH